MPVKIGTMTTPTSPFEFIHESGNRVQEKDTSFAEEFFKQQSEGVSRKEMEAMLKKLTSKPVGTEWGVSAFIRPLEKSPKIARRFCCAKIPMLRRAAYV